MSRRELRVEEAGRDPPKAPWMTGGGFPEGEVERFMSDGYLCSLVG